MDAMFEDHAYFTVHTTRVGGLLQQIRMYDVGVCMMVWTTNDSPEAYEWFSVVDGRVLFEGLSAEQRKKERESKKERLAERRTGYVVMSHSNNGTETTEIRRYTGGGRVFYRNHGIRGGKQWFEHEETLPEACQRLDEQYKAMKMHEETVIARWKEMDAGSVA